MAKRYKPETKTDAIARMWVTAIEHADGEWVPNYQSVEVGMRTDARSESPDRRTLKRWWLARNRSKDAQSRAVQAKTRQDAAERGALTQIEGMLSVLFTRMQAIVNDEAAWDDTELPLPQKTQAAMNMTRALTLAGPLLQAGGKGEQEETGEDRAARYAAAAQRTGASKGG